MPERDQHDSKRSRSHHSTSSKHHSKSSKRSKGAVVEEDEWVEKSPELVVAAVVARSTGTGPPLDPAPSTFSVDRSSDLPSRSGFSRPEESLTDGYGTGEVGDTTGTGSGRGADNDFFSGMGIERKRKEKKVGVDPTETMGQSSRELNKSHWQPNLASTSTPAPSVISAPVAIVPGSSGSAWRMSKLKRTYEAAEEEGRDLDEVVLERYGSKAGWEEAKEERRVLDERDDRRRSRGGGGGFNNGNSSSNSRSGTPQRFIYNDTGPGENSRPPSRSEFRRPGETAMERSGSSSNLNQLQNRHSTPGSRTPVPNVFTPEISRTPRGLGQTSNLNPASSSASAVQIISSSLDEKPVLTQSELNKLQSTVLKAKLLDSPNAGGLEAEYERERIRTLNRATFASTNETGRGVQVLPTLDGHGRLYDIGQGNEEPEEKGGKRKKKEKFESHDATGAMLARSADDSSITLAELVRQERFSGGSADQKNLDSEMAARIAGDARFINSLDYVDENAESLARKKMKSEVLKKAFAVNDYARTKKALDSCTLCFADSGAPPRAAVVALGTRAYLGLMENEELVKGHCRIVPIQHHFSTLEAEEETWDEIKGFMKTLMQMFATEDRGVVFFESVINLKSQRHTCIEAIPLPFELFDEIPGYFQEAILSSEQEWSQHKKLITFTPARPFRRSLVPNLPYFAIQWDYKGEKGFGHVMEGVDDGPERDADGDEMRGEVGEKGGGEFSRYFATEIIGNLLELEPRQWRKPRRLDFRNNKDRVAQFMLQYDTFDWTKALRA